MEILNFKPISLIIEKLSTWAKLFMVNLPNLLLAIIVVIVFWILSNSIYSVFKNIFKKTQFSESIENLIASVAKLTCILVGIMLALSVVKLDKAVLSLLAGVGVVGLALGFAFRDLASNFISGLMIATTEPFKIGDIIKIGSLHGTVREIRLRDTLIKNFDGQDVLVPNKDFMTSQIENYSTHGKRKVVIEFGVDYEDDLEKTKKLISSKLENVEGILSDPSLAINYLGFEDSSIKMKVSFWIKYPGGDLSSIKDECILRIKRILDDGEFNMPYPVQTLKVSEDVLNKFKEKVTT